MVLHQCEPASNIIVNREFVVIQVSLLLKAKKDLAFFLAPVTVPYAVSVLSALLSSYRAVQRGAKAPIEVPLSTETPRALELVLPINKFFPSGCPFLRIESMERKLEIRNRRREKKRKEKKRKEKKREDPR